MRVVLAEHAGACYGVQRALDMALAAADEAGAAQTLGPLIHNPLVVSQLERKGVTVAQDLDGISADTVIIRSHGVTPEVRGQLLARCGNVVDATCPHVRRAQEAAGDLARAGCCVVVLGEDGHPEVEGLKAYARRDGAKVDVVSGAADVPADLRAPVGVVVQTTQRREVLDEVVEAIRARGIEPAVKNTICFATRQRQDAAAALAAQVDAIVVIGGRNSSNTTRLAEICERACARTFHVESPAEIDPSWFAPDDVVGVTAGASTPEDQIGAVVELLESL